MQAINPTQQQQKQGAHLQKPDGSIMDDFFKQLNGTTSHLANFTQPAAFVANNLTTASSTNTNATAVGPASPTLKNMTANINKPATPPHIKITRNGAFPLTPSQQQQHQRNLSSSSSTPLKTSNNNNSSRTSLFKGNTTKTVNGKETFYYRPNNNSTNNTTRTASNATTLDLNHNNRTVLASPHTTKNNFTKTSVRKSEIPHPPAHFAKVMLIDDFQNSVFSDIL